MRIWSMFHAKALPMLWPLSSPGWMISIYSTAVNHFTWYVGSRAMISPSSILTPNSMSCSSVAISMKDLSVWNSWRCPSSGPQNRQAILFIDYRWGHYFLEWLLSVTSLSLSLFFVSLSRAFPCWTWHSTCSLVLNHFLYCYIFQKSSTSQEWVISICIEWIF